MNDLPDAARTKDGLLALQDDLCAGFERVDGAARFREDRWERAEGGGGRSRVLSDGAVFEKAGVGFSHVKGDRLPPSATAHRPELAGRSWEALGVSVVMHPRNPYAPTSHMNVRFFAAGDVFWFGGGFDLTPYYGFREDAIDWHRAARDAVAPYGADLYPRFKRACDEYFYLKHRGEARGIGGIFFDDFNALGFARGLDLILGVGQAYLRSYSAIVARRHPTPFGDRERQFQLRRRGRYVEFNLLYDRGTLFGLQSGGRTESILMSLPPLVRWDYAWEPDKDTAEARLAADFLQPRDWADLQA